MNLINDDIRNGAIMLYNDATENAFGCLDHAQRVDSKDTPALIAAGQAWATLAQAAAIMATNGTLRTD